MNEKAPPVQAENTDRAHEDIRRALSALARLTAARAEALVDEKTPDEKEERRLASVILSLRRLKEVDDRYEKQRAERAASESAAGGRRDIPSEEELQELAGAAVRRAMEELPDDFLDDAMQRIAAPAGENAACEETPDSSGGEGADATLLNGVVHAAGEDCCGQCVEGAVCSAPDRGG